MVTQFPLVAKDSSRLVISSLSTTWRQPHSIRLSVSRKPAFSCSDMTADPRYTNLVYTGTAHTMANLTITVDEEVLKHARLRVTAQGTS